MKFTLFDDDDLKRLEDTIAKAMSRAIVSAIKFAVRDGLLLRPGPAPEPEVVGAPTEPTARPVPQPVWPEPAPTPPERVPAFLKPPPDRPFPNGKAVEPPAPLKHYAKTRNLYQQLYKTVSDRPHGYITIPEAVDFLGGQSKSGQVSTWLQRGEVDAVIVASLKPPTKGLPGKLMIDKASLAARQRKVLERRRAA